MMAGRTCASMCVPIYLQGHERFAAASSLWLFHDAAKMDKKGEAIIVHRCTVSIGAALFLDHESNGGDILKRADAAMYEAKADGRDRVAIHEFVPERATPIAGDARVLQPD